MPSESLARLARKWRPPWGSPLRCAGERLVDEARGSYAFCDTDSMAIVATEHGKDRIACPGGSTRTETSE